jgi:hypothetical protein
MNRIRNCTEVKRRLAAFREGWLSSDDARTIGDHLKECPTCAAEAAADAKLVSALGDLQVDPVSVPTLNLPDRRRRALGWRPALAAAAALALVLLWVGFGRLGRSPGTPLAQGTSVEARAPDEAFSDAHFMLAASDMGADPNRAILLGGIGRKNKERTR